MGSKRIIFLTILSSILILIGGLPMVLPPSRTILGASAVGTTSGDYGLIQMGYSAAQLTALNVSIPTFTSGDFMWVQTRFNSTASVMLINPNGSAVSNKNVQPDSPAMIFSFNSTNGADGVWSLNVSSSSVGNLLVPITFVSPTSHEMQAGLLSYGFKGDRLAAGFSLSSQSAYGTEGCLLSNFPASVIPLSTQPEFGGPLMLENFLNGSVLITEGASPSQPFELFLEMFYLYSYQTPGSSSFDSTFQETAFTNPVVISTGGQISYTPLDSLVGMRNGTYELRVFFEVGGNLSVEQTEILFRGVSQPWVWLGGCQMSVPQGPIFVATSNLYNSTNSGPLTLFLSYYVDGVDLFYLQPVSLELSELQFFVNSLQASPNDIGIEASTREGNLTIVGESIWVVTENQLAELNYSLTFGGSVFQKSPAIFLYGSKVQDINLSRLEAVAAFKGMAYPNATLVLQNMNLGGNVTILSGIQGNATFFAPGGNYTLTALVNGSRFVREISLVNGETFREVVSLNPVTGSNLSLPELSVIVLGVVALGIGIFANAWVWLFRGRRAMKKRLR